MTLEDKKKRTLKVICDVLSFLELYLPDDLPHEVVVEHVLALDCGELLFDELAHVGQILRGVN
jgi:hypothetical protein